MKEIAKHLVVLLLAFATMTCLFFGCNKEKNENTIDPNQVKASAMMKRINDFQELRDAINSGVKSSGVMTVEEMRQAIDVTFNYEHSEHMTYCDHTILDTFYIAMPNVDENGNVTEMDAVNTYNAFETELERLMLSVNDGMNTPSCFSIIMPNTGAKDDGEIKIVFTRGQQGDQTQQALPEMFASGPGLCLYWGYGLGCCNSVNPIICQFDDATDFLSQLFQFSETPPGPSYTLILCNVEYVTYTAYDYPYNSFGWVYWEPTTPPSCADHWLYVAYGEYDTEPCICWDELGCYYSTVSQHVADSENGELYFSPTYHSPFFECSFDWHHLYNPNSQPEKRSVRIHSLEIKYADYYWYSQLFPK